MKKRIVLLTMFVTLAIFTAITGCKRNDDVYYYGDLTFWNNDLNEDITVTIEGYSATITVNNDTYDCNMSGRANFSLTQGYHHYYAYSRNHTWENDIYVDGGICKLVQL